MFAANGASRTYHLVEGAKRQTVCGLRVMTVVLSKPNLPVVCAVEAPPQDHRLCPHCRRLAFGVPVQNVHSYARAVA